MDSSTYTGREVPAPPAPPTRVELVARGTAAAEREQAQVSHELALAELHREEKLSELLDQHQRRQKAGVLPDAEGPPSPAELWTEAGSGPGSRGA